LRALNNFMNKINKVVLHGHTFIHTDISKELPNLSDILDSCGIKNKRSIIKKLNRILSFCANQHMMYNKCFKIILDLDDNIDIMKEYDEIFSEYGDIHSIINLSKIFVNICDNYKTMKIIENNETEQIEEFRNIDIRPKIIKIHGKELVKTCIFDLPMLGEYCKKNRIPPNSYECIRLSQILTEYANPHIKDEIFEKVTRIFDIENELDEHVLKYMKCIYYRHENVLDVYDVTMQFINLCKNYKSNVVKYNFANDEIIKVKRINDIVDKIKVIYDQEFIIPSLNFI